MNGVFVNKENQVRLQLGDIMKQLISISTCLPKLIEFTLSIIVQSISYTHIINDNTPEQDNGNRMLSMKSLSFPYRTTFMFISIQCHKVIRITIWFHTFIGCTIKRLSFHTSLIEFAIPSLLRLDQIHPLILTISFTCTIPTRPAVIFTATQKAFNAMVPNTNPCVCISSSICLLPSKDERFDDSHQFHS